VPTLFPSFRSLSPHRSLVMRGFFRYSNYAHLPTRSPRACVAFGCQYIVLEPGLVYSDLPCVTFRKFLLLMHFPVGRLPPSDVVYHAPGPGLRFFFDLLPISGRFESPFSPEQSPAAPQTLVVPLLPLSFYPARSSFQSFSISRSPLIRRARFHLLHDLLFLLPLPGLSSDLAFVIGCIFCSSFPCSKLDEQGNLISPPPATLSWLFFAVHNPFTLPSSYPFSPAASRISCSQE